MQAMQGGAATKTPEEEAMEDTEMDDLAVEEHKQRDSDTMQVCDCVFLLLNHFPFGCIFRWVIYEA